MHQPAERERRLALLLPDLGGGGAERVALALLQGFLDRGYLVDLVLARRQGALLPLVPGAVEVVDLGAAKLRQLVLPLVRYLREQRPYALHAMMWPLPLLAILARALAGVDTRIVGSEHTTLSTMPHGLRRRVVRVLTRRAYMRADGLVGVSAGVADDLSAFVGVPRDRITVIHNPLLLPGSLPNRTVAAARWPAGTKRILAVGALKAEKNYPLLLRALARVRGRIPASLLILGDGPLKNALKKQVADLGLTNAVVFAGFEIDPWPYYLAADLFVLSSDFEGFGNVLVEAMHAGLPVVSTDCPNGPREILDGGRFGALLPCDDEVALADAIYGASHSIHDQDGARARARTLSGREAMTKHICLMLGCETPKFNLLIDQQI